MAPPFIVRLAIILVALNPLLKPELNPGPGFFRRTRLGRPARVVRVWTSRTMTQAPVHEGCRSHADGVEHHPDHPADDLGDAHRARREVRPGGPAPMGSLHERSHRSVQKRASRRRHFVRRGPHAR